MVVVQLRRVLVHDLLRLMHRVLAVEGGPVRIRLLVGVLVDEEVLDAALARHALVHGKAGGEFAVGADLDRVEHRHREGLAVVADQVVGRA